MSNFHHTLMILITFVLTLIWVGIVFKLSVKYFPAMRSMVPKEVIFPFMLAAAAMFLGTVFINLMVRVVFIELI